MGLQLQFGQQYDLCDRSKMSDWSRHYGGRPMHSHTATAPWIAVKVLKPLRRSAVPIFRCMKITPTGIRLLSPRADYDMMQRKRASSPCTGRFDTLARAKDEECKSVCD